MLTRGAAAIPLRAQRVVARRREQPLEATGEVAALVCDRRALGTEVVDERHPVGGDQVPAPELHGIEPELGGEDVEQALADERRLGHPRPAIGADGRSVREHRVRGELERLPDVRPREVVPGQDRREDALRPHVRALVDPGRAAQREQAALGGRGDLDVVHLAARVVRRDEMLRAILDPLHRAAETERGERDEHVLGIELAADAEAAADVDLHEPHVVEGEPEQLCEHPAVEVLHLRRAVDRHASAHRLGEEPAGLERRTRLPLAARGGGARRRPPPRRPPPRRRSGAGSC